MNCAECEILLHALIDGELDAGHARDVEAHVASCAGCAEKLKAFRAMRERDRRSRPERGRAGAFAQPDRGGAAVRPRRLAEDRPPRQFLQPSRRTFFGGFAAGAALSAAVAASLVLTVFRSDQEQTSPTKSCPRISARCSPDT